MNAKARLTALFSLAIVLPACADVSEDNGYYASGESFGDTEDGESGEAGEEDGEEDGEEQETGEETGGEETGEEGGDEDGCQDADGCEPEPGTCVDVHISTDPDVIPTVLMLVDQSGSMTEDFGDQSRWNAVYETLMDEDAGIAKQLEDRVSLGMALYTSEQGFEGGECPQLTEVAPSLYNRDAMEAVFSAAAPVDDTPTGDALMAVAEKLANLQADGPKAIVLATDGHPDTCEQPDPQQGEGEAIAAAQVAHDLGIKTYIISVGDDVGDEHLQDMANAGAGLEIDGDQDEPFFKAFHADDLVNAFDEISEQVENCILPLDNDVDVDYMCDGTVTLDGEALECLADWHLLDSNTLELTGAACDTLRNGEAHDVNASWECAEDETEGPYIP